jgi:hypothetical protein
VLSTRLQQFAAATAFSSMTLANTANALQPTRIQADMLSSIVFLCCAAMYHSF